MGESPVGHAFILLTDIVGPDEITLLPSVVVASLDLGDAVAFDGLAGL